MRQLFRDPLLSSIRVIDGLFYKAAVTVEADADARFFQSVAAKLTGRDDVYFVNADNKQTVPKVMSAYRNGNIPSAGVVDFDALNSASVLESLMDAGDVREPDRQRIRCIRDNIEKHAGTSPPLDRVREAQRRVEAIMGELVVIERGIQSAGSADSHRGEKELSGIRSRLSEIADGTKVWTELKRRGREALPHSLQVEFDELYSLLSQYGIFVVPSGELESMLVDQGIDTTTDKRAWIQRALQLLVSLSVEPDKQPWKLMSDIIKYVNTVTAPAPKTEMVPAIEDPALDCMPRAAPRRVLGGQAVGEKSV